MIAVDARKVTMITTMFRAIRSISNTHFWQGTENNVSKFVQIQLSSLEPVFEQGYSYLFYKRQI